MEVDKLKRLLLDPDQISLFEYINKPIISSNYGICKNDKDLKINIDNSY